MLLPNWLSNATYLGTTYFSWNSYNKWGQTWSNGNTIEYLQEVNSNYPYSMQNTTIDGSKDDSNKYLYNDWKIGKIDNSAFDLPKYCSGTTCPLTSKCGEYRRNTIK